MKHLLRLKSDCAVLKLVDRWTFEYSPGSDPVFVRIRRLLRVGQEFGSMRQFQLLKANLKLESGTL